MISAANTASVDLRTLINQATIGQGICGVSQVHQVGPVISMAMAVWFASGCASQPWYDTPPPMPLPVSPSASANLGAVNKVEFLWRASDQTESYDFHIFNAETADIDQFMLKGMSVASICQGDLCGITVDLGSLPESERHAWRIRSTNVAGASGWTRSPFTWQSGVVGASRR